MQPVKAHARTPEESAAVPTDKGVGVGPLGRSAVYRAPQQHYKGAEGEDSSNTYADEQLEGGS